MSIVSPGRVSAVLSPFGRLPYKWQALVVTSSASLFATLTMSIVNISLPNIAQAFQSTLAVVEWVLVVYPLITVSTMLAVGYLGDLVGRKRIFTLGAAIFSVSSLLCGLAQSPWQLIAFRVLQGLGGAMLIGNTAAIITGAFPANERGKALGLQSTIGAIGLSAGPTIGGLLIDSFGWRWIFLVAVPLTVLTTVLAFRLLRDPPRGSRHASFDAVGSVILFVALACLLLALSEVQENGWDSPRFVALAAVFLLSGASFVPVELRAALPTVDITLLRQRLFAAAACTSTLGYAAMFGVLFLMPFYLTRTVGFSSAQAGTLLSAIPIAMALTAGVSGWLSDRFGSRGLCALGMALCTLAALLMAQLDQNEEYAAIGLRLLLFGLGIGVAMSPNNSVMMGCAPAARLGMASALVATVRHLGIALGVALAGVVFTVRLAAYAHTGGAAIAGSWDAAVSVGAFRDTYLVLALLCAISTLTALVRGSKRPVS